MEQNSVYCIYCETSKENKVEKLFQRLGYNIISALVERNVIKNKKTVKEYRPIISGYVFIECDFEPDWYNIKKLNYVHYPLQYSDKSKKLKDNDLYFIKWLKENNGKIKISKAMEIGKKIKIIEGPLKELEGNIVKINKKQKCAGIKIDGEKINNIIWLSYEIIE